MLPSSARLWWLIPASSMMFIDIYMNIGFFMYACQFCLKSLKRWENCKIDILQHMYMQKYKIDLIFNKARFGIYNI